MNTTAFLISFGFTVLILQLPKYISEICDRRAMNKRKRKLAAMMDDLIKRTETNDSSSER